MVGEAEYKRRNADNHHMRGCKLRNVKVIPFDPYLSPSFHLLLPFQPLSISLSSITAKWQPTSPVG